MFNLTAEADALPGNSRMLRDLLLKEMKAWEVTWSSPTSMRSGARHDIVARQAWQSGPHPLD